jgi:hypothetical protein
MVRKLHTSRAHRCANNPNTGFRQTNRSWRRPNRRVAPKAQNTRPAVQTPGGQVSPSESVTRSAIAIHTDNDSKRTFPVWRRAKGLNSGLANRLCLWSAVWQEIKSETNTDRQTHHANVWHASQAAITIDTSCRKSSGTCSSYAVMVRQMQHSSLPPAYHWPADNRSSRVSVLNTTPSVPKYKIPQSLNISIYRTFDHSSY